MVPEDSITVKVPVQGISGNQKNVLISFNDIADDNESVQIISFNSEILPTKKNEYYEYSNQKNEILKRWKTAGNLNPPPVVKVTVTDLRDEDESIFIKIFKFYGRSDYMQYQILQ